MAGKNYGIGYCKKVLKSLKEKEDEMIVETGLGFDYFSQEVKAERRYRRLLKEFQREKDKGLPPSFNPEIHGNFE